MRVMNGQGYIRIDFGGAAAFRQPDPDRPYFRAMERQINQMEDRAATADMNPFQRLLYGARDAVTTSREEALAKTIGRSGRAASIGEDADNTSGRRRHRDFIENADSTAEKPALKKGGAPAPAQAQAQEEDTDISKLQKSLAQMGYTGSDGKTPLANSGVFDTDTNAAIAKFYQDYNSDKKPEDQIRLATFPETLALVEKERQRRSEPTAAPVPDQSPSPSLSSAQGIIDASTLDADKEYERLRAELRTFRTSAEIATGSWLAPALAERWSYGTLGSIFDESVSGTTNINTGVAPIPSAADGLNQTFMPVAAGTTPPISPSAMAVEAIDDGPPPPPIPTAPLRPLR